MTNAVRTIQTQRLMTIGAYQVNGTAEMFLCRVEYFHTVSCYNKNCYKIECYSLNCR